MIEICVCNRLPHYRRWPLISHNFGLAGSILWYSKKQLLDLTVFIQKNEIAFWPQVRPLPALIKSSIFIKFKRFMHEIGWIHQLFEWYCSTLQSNGRKVVVKISKKLTELTFVPLKDSNLNWLEDYKKCSHIAQKQRLQLWQEMRMSLVSGSLLPLSLHSRCRTWKAESLAFSIDLALWPTTLAPKFPKVGFHL